MFVEKFENWVDRRKILKFAAAAVVSAAIFASLILPISLRPTPTLLDVGDVAFQDIRAPRSFSFTSEYLTEQAMESAESSVSPVYLPADPAISRRQVERLREILSFINSIRADEFANLDQKISDLIAIEDLNLTEETAQLILTAGNESWDSIQTESLFLLEQVMRSPIREDQVSTVRRNLSPQVGFEFNEEQTEIIRIFVSPLIVANSLFSQESTEEAIQKAREAVEPVTKSYASGEIIVSSGEVIDPVAFEALKELGYMDPNSRLSDYVSAALVVISLMTFNILYLIRTRKNSGKRIEGISVITLLFLVFLYAARFILPNHAILPYLFPLAAFGLTVSSIFSYEIGLFFSISLSIFASFGQTELIDLSLYYLIPTGLAIFILGRGRRITKFFLSGLGIAVSGSVLVIAYRLLNSFLDVAGGGTLVGAAFVNGFGSISLALILQYALAQILGKTTALQLLDLSRPDHPLLQELLRNAPGTYQHSLQVANLAEQAAEEINADPLLTRVGALYHDIGKSKNPTFFIENQLPSQVNPHNDLDPLIASATIIQHVEDGLKMARKYNLPPQIEAFIIEHHGTTITRYQYEQAVEKSGDSGKVDEDLFRYGGLKPHSKETALLMLADGCEAIVRSESPETRQQIAELVRDAIDMYQKQGQLDHTDLTLNDLRIIAKSFSRTLQNTYHHRIKYPNQEDIPSDMDVS